MSVQVCDPKSLLYLFGMELDYSDELIGKCVPLELCPLSPIRLHGNALVCEHEYIQYVCA